MDWLLTLARPEESQAVDGGPERKQQVVVSDKDGVVRRVGGWGMGEWGYYSRVRITCIGGDLSQAEILYPVNFRHTSPCQMKLSENRDAFH